MKTLLIILSILALPAIVLICYILWWMIVGAFAYVPIVLLILIAIVCVGQFLDRRKK